MAVLDPRTGEVVHEIRVEDLTDVEPEPRLPGWTSSAHLFGPKVVLTTETHAFVIDPETGDVLRASAVRALTDIVQLEPPGRQDRGAPDVEREADPRGRPPDRTPTACIPSSVVGVDDAGTAIRHLQGHDRTAAPRRTSSSVTRSGDRIGPAHRVDGHVVDGGVPPRRTRGRRCPGRGRGHPRRGDAGLLAHPGGTQRRGARPRSSPDRRVACCGPPARTAPPSPST